MLLRLYQHFFPIYEQELEKALSGCESVLDVGCGSNSPLARVPKTYISVGVDLHKPSIAISKKRKIHDSYVVLDIKMVGKQFPPKSFDAVLASDVLEHLTKKDGMQLLKSMERIARKRVIVFKPSGYLPQDVYENNPLQQHQSGWNAAELKKLGYVVTGMHGLKMLRGEHSAIKYKPRRLWVFLSDLSQRVVRHFPNAAFALLAVKQTSG